MNIKSYINIQLKGDDFSPTMLREKTNLPIEVIIDSGDIAKIGRYKGKKSPYGIGVISFLFDEAKVIGYSNKLKKIKRTEHHLDEIVFDFIFAENESFDISPIVLKSITDISANFTITDSKPHQKTVKS